MEEDPFFGPYAEGWRIVRPRTRARGLLFIRTFWFYGMSSLVLSLVAFLLIASMDDPAVLLLIVPLMGGYLLLIWTSYSKQTNPARVFELRKDSVLLFEQGRGKGPLVDIPYTRDVEVDVYLDQKVNWGGAGMPCGWTFSKGTDRIRLHPDENWDLWSLQDISRPILWLVEQYNMAKGEGLERYMVQLRDRPDNLVEPWDR